ncbi:MAG: glutamine amidotransferase [Anaerolineales bacterium]|nr:glutamine amidotransferase [Anaerolineales bacterium]
MCGIAGIMIGGDSDLGDAVYRMLYEIRHRGGDAAGASLYLSQPRGYVVGRVSLLDPQTDLPVLREIVNRHAELGDCQTHPTNSPYTLARLSLQVESERLPALYRDINSRPSLCVHSLSNCMEVIKDVGTAEALAAFGQLRRLRGSHALGHTRLATESIDNLNFAHPFTSDLYPELSVVHNGQLTNYFKLRRRLAAWGVCCKTFNDSEIIAHYLAYLIRRRGYTFEAALRASLDDFDGVFSYLAATESQMGAVRDRLGIKPILFFQQNGLLLLGSEQVSFEAVDPDVFATEMAPGEVKLWSKN